MTDIETAIMIKNMAREMVKKATARNAAVKGAEVFHNGNAVILTGEVIKKHGAEWYVGHDKAGKEVVVSKEKYDKAYGFNATAKNAGLGLGGMDVTLKSGKKANARLVLSEKKSRGGAAAG